MIGYQEEDGQEEKWDVLLAVLCVVSNVVVEQTNRYTDNDVRNEAQLRQHLIPHDTQEGAL